MVTGAAREAGMDWGELFDAQRALADLQVTLRRAEVEAVMIANRLTDAAAEAELDVISSDLKRLRTRVLAVYATEPTL